MISIFESISTDICFKHKPVTLKKNHYDPLNLINKDSMTKIVCIEGDIFQMTGHTGIFFLGVKSLDEGWQESAQSGHTVTIQIMWTDAPHEFYCLLRLKVKKHSMSSLPETAFQQFCPCLTL